MVQVIVAMTKKGGIGFKNKLPWFISEEMNIFRNKTMGKTLVMGRLTAQSVPKLSGRQIICVTNNPLNIGEKSCPNQPMRYIKNLSDITTLADLVNSDDIFIAGGAQIYRLALENSKIVDKIHLSIIDNDYECDTFFEFDWFSDFVITEEIKYTKFTHYVLERTSNGEQQYLNVLKQILAENSVKHGRNGKTISLFKQDMKFDLRNGFPLLTTKKMFIKGIVEEFIFFLNGKTDSSELSEKNVRIWEDNTSLEFLNSLGLKYAKGVMGPMYGYQWRFFNAPYNVGINGKPIDKHPSGGIDQLENVIKLIKTEPDSRRILMTAYNPSQAEEGVLYPCHSIIIQFYVENEYLDMFCYNRSQDFALGTPFNIASSSLLLMVVAKLTQKQPRFFYLSTGDTHIYDQHIEKVKLQLDRIPYKFPKLKIPDIKTIEDISTMNSSQFILSDYICYSPIVMSMVA